MRQEEIDNNEEKNMYCSNCGEKLDEDVKYCPYCGTAVEYKLSEKNGMGTSMHVNLPSASDNSNEKIFGGNKRKKKALSFLIIVLIVGILIFAFVRMVSGEKSDLEKLEGAWRNSEGDGVIFYAPYDDISGDAELVEDGEVKAVTYEWHGSSKRIVFNYNDQWGDRIEEVYKYEIEELGKDVLYAYEWGFGDDMVLRLTPVEASDSTGTYSFEDQEAVEFYKN